MVYFDNAATSRPKPEAVLSAFVDFVREVGASPGRGSYSLGIQASRMLYQSRKTVTGFFGCPNKTNVVFTKNSTEAINLFFNGFLNEGDHVLISPFEHNAVLRPLHSLMQQEKIQYEVFPEEVLQNPEAIRKMFRPNTRLVAITLASNLTGQIVFNRDIAEVCKRNSIQVFVDASQGGGKMLVNMARDNIDFLAFTGHKDLLGLPGVGGLCSLEELSFKPLVQGGTGIHGEEYTNPAIYPDGYEAGTLNMPSIWALKTSLDYLSEHHTEISTIENALMQHLISGLTALPNIEVIRPDVARVPTICINVIGKPSSEVVSFLDQHGVCVRGGIHCAILAHKTIGTVKTGAVRISLNNFNTHEEIDYLLKLLREA
ncbi:MAG: aminotransferase class V-fold PLP-dependent enzyme [Clostridiales bacterium]|nr:aminotransferase class V-fold PLP-dependent enzyme [Clostridiales bacterium]